MKMANAIFSSFRRIRHLRGTSCQCRKQALLALDSPLRHPCNLRLPMIRSFTSNAPSDEGTRVEESSEGSAYSAERNSFEDAVEGNLTDDAVEGNLTEDLSERNSADSVTNGGLDYEASIKVPAPILGLVIGRRGATINSIQKATQSRIKVPPGREVRSGVSLVVKGTSQEGVDAAITRIKNILQKAEKNPLLEYSHFISVPLAYHEDLVERVRNFRESVLLDEEEADNYISWFPQSVNKENSKVIMPSTIKKVPKIKASYILDPDLEGFFSDDESSDEEEENSFEINNTRRSRIKKSFFVRPETFHLTILMLKLYTEQSVHLAAEVLQEIQPRLLEALDGYEPKVHLRGIECLRGNPAEARVVCMRVHEMNLDNPFQRACYIIRDAFADAGLVAAKDRSQDIKLHATLMNANYAPSLETRYFDARKVLLKHQYQDWGVYTLKEIHLSQRFFYDPNGYYRCCGSLELPSVSKDVEEKDPTLQS